MNLKTCQESVIELQTFRLKRKFIHCLSYGERESSSVVQLGNMPWRELFKNMAPENNSCTHHTWFMIMALSYMIFYYSFYFDFVYFFAYMVTEMWKEIISL